LVNKSFMCIELTRYFFSSKFSRLDFKNCTQRYLMIYLLITVIVKTSVDVHYKYKWSKKEFYRLVKLHTSGYVFLYHPACSDCKFIRYVFLKTRIQPILNTGAELSGAKPCRHERTESAFSTSFQREHNRKRWFRFLALFLYARHDSSFLHASYALRNRFPRNETNAFP